MKVTKKEDVPAGSGNTFNFYIYALLTGGPFTLSKTINHGSSNNGTLDGETSDISDVYEVYYYKHNNQNKGALKVKAMNGDKIFYNTNTSTTNGTWKNQETTPITSASEPDLNTLVDKIKDQVEIKVDKIKPYGCNKRIIVQKRGGDGSSSNPVPNDYVRYKHYSTSANFKLGLVRYKDIPLTFNPALTTENVTAVYVYYSQTGDDDHQFPLIVCIKFSSTWNYYKRGNTWSVDNQLNSIDPENPGGDLTKLQTSLNDVKGNLSCILLL